MAGYTCLSLPFLLVAAFVGYKLLGIPTQSSFPRVAGWLTLKPILATPLWEVLSIAADPRNHGDLTWVRYFGIGTAPAVILTSIILCRYSKIFAETHRFALLYLLIADCVRWGTTVAVFNTRPGLIPEDITIYLVLLALFMPIIFSFIAFQLTKAVLHADRSSASVE